ncbi:MAG: proline hydroxylase, partial [Mesorhizobium sp.]
MTIHSISSHRKIRSAQARVADQDWRTLTGELNAHGCAV